MQSQVERICEMGQVMRRAVQVDDKHYCCVRERLAQLEVRNAVIHGHNDTFPLEVCGKICDFTTDHSFSESCQTHWWSCDNLGLVLHLSTVNSLNHPKIPLCTKVFLSQM